MPRRKLHDEDEDEVTTVGSNDDLGPLDEDEEFDLFDDPVDDDDEWWEDEDEDDESYEED